MYPDSFIKRFLENVPEAPKGSCWTWQGTAHSLGYGRIGLGNKTLLAHRVSFELAHGEIPPGMHVDHTCWNRSCVNPNHLQLVTPELNSQNRSGPASSSKTGVRGVRLEKGKYRARVNTRQRNFHIGYFDSLEEAEAAVSKARRIIFQNSLADHRKFRSEAA